MRLALALAVWCGALAPALVAPALADRAGQPGSFHDEPSAMAFTGADRSVMFFGGRDYYYAPYYPDQRVQPPQLTDWIVRMNQDGSTSRLASRLPGGRDQASAVWSGRYAYVFGGRTFYNPPTGQVVYSNQVVRVDPILDVAQAVATLPYVLVNTPVAWDAATASAYLMVGNAIVKFTPEPLAYGTMSPRFPTGFIPSYAATVGANVYVVGGTSGATSTSLYRYHPPTNTLTLLSPAFQAASRLAGMTGDASFLYVFERPAGLPARLQRFDPADGSASVLPVAIPAGTGSGLAFDGRDVWLLQRPVARYRPATQSIDPFPSAAGATGISDPRFGSPAFDGTNLYGLVGSGDAYASQRVFRLTPSTGAITPLVSTPAPRASAAAASDGRYVYFFGGWSPSDGRHYADILRYDPAANTLTTAAAQLPALARTAAAYWDGQRFVVFAYTIRAGSTSLSVQVLLYDPVAERITARNTFFPGLSLEAASFDGRYVYVFDVPRILRYDTVRDETTVMKARLPKSRFVSSSAWNGRSIYVFGGWRAYYTPYEECWVCAKDFDEVWRYDPVADTLSPMHSPLPGPISSVFTSAWDGRAFDLVGIPAVLDGPPSTIVRYFPEPAAPLITNIEPGVASGQATVSLRKPGVRTSGSPVRGYRVWRDGGSGDDTLVSEVGPATRFTLSGLDPGAEITLRITAVTDDGEGPASLAASGRSLAADAPQRPQATLDVYSGLVTLTWQAPATPPGAITSFTITRTPPGGTETTVGSVSGSTTTFSEYAPQWNLRHLYRVRAVTASGTGPPSVGAPSIALSAPSAPSWFTALPYPPHGYVALQWQQPNDDGGLPVTAYRIWRGENNQPLTLWHEVPADWNSLLDTFTPSGVYQYAVTAVTPLGEGPRSLEFPVVATSDEFVVGP